MKNKSLKHATPRMKYIHMNHVMDFKARLKEHQAQEAKRIFDETMKTCEAIRGLSTQAEYNAWWETTPDSNIEFLNAAKEKLAELHSREQETTAAECERISQWLSDNWDYIPEIPFGEGV